MYVRSFDDSRIFALLYLRSDSTTYTVPLADAKLSGLRGA